MPQQPVLNITNMVDAIAAANILLDNDFRPFQAANGPYEMLSSQIKPGVVLFQTGWFPIDVENITAVVDDAPTNSVTVVDADHGLVSVTPMPTRSLSVAYRYKRLTTVEIEQCAVNALSDLELYADPGQLPQGLYAAFFHYLKAEGYSIIAAKYAEQINVSLRGRSEQRAQMSKAFKDMSDQQYKLGDNARQMFYKRAGAREAPSVGRAVISLTPWAPYR